MTSRNALLAGSLLMALGVLAGAFGAHIMQSLLTPERHEVYRTAVEYHFYHALGLLLIGIAGRLTASGKGQDRLAFDSWYKWSGRLILAGVLIFSGSLYLLVLTDTAWLGAVTPFGGVALVAGWLCLSVAVAKRHRNSRQNN